MWTLGGPAALQVTRAAEKMLVGIPVVKALQIHPPPTFKAATVAAVVAAGPGRHGQTINTI